MVLSKTFKILYLISSAKMCGNTFFCKLKLVSQNQNKFNNFLFSSRRGINVVKMKKSTNFYSSVAYPGHFGSDTDPLIHISG